MPGDRWTLIGGLMVQIHMAHAGLPLSRATVDIDMVLHLETGIVTFVEARDALASLGYDLEIPRGKGPIHRFSRGTDQVDMMAADCLAPAHVPTAEGRKLFQVPAGTSALRKTVNCTIELPGQPAVTLSVPDSLGALVLKGAAFKSDPRDRDRHLDDAAWLACTVESPTDEAARLEGSDRGRIRRLADQLRDEDHPSWRQVPIELRPHGMHVLNVLARDPSPPPTPRRLGQPKGSD